MEVLTPGDVGGSAAALRTLVVGSGLAAVLSLPALVVQWYASLVTTAAVVVAIGAAGRLALLAIPALVVQAQESRQGPPALPGDPPTVSVVVTAYDEADVLPGTIAALARVDYPADALEVLLCYEGTSTDATAAIAERAADRYPFVRAIQRDRPPGGKAAATNYALPHAGGEVVGVLDADQVLEPDALRRVIARFEDDGAGANGAEQSDEAGRGDEIGRAGRGDVTGGGVWCITGRRFGTNPRASLLALYATVEHHLAERVEFVGRDLLGGFALFTGGQAFFRTATFDRVGRFDEDVLLEDVEFACRLHARGMGIRVDPRIVTREGNPTTLRAWWHQRVRWARGGLQAGRRHLPGLVTRSALSSRRKVDAVATFGALVAIALLTLAAPGVALALALGGDVAPVLPPWWPLVIGVALFGVPLCTYVALVALDHRAGRAHARRELLAVLTLPLYGVLQALAVTTAFVDEFVRARPPVYVTS